MRLELSIVMFWEDLAQLVCGVRMNSYPYIIQKIDGFSESKLALMKQSVIGYLIVYASVMCIRRMHGHMLTTSKTVGVLKNWCTYGINLVAIELQFINFIFIKKCSDFHLWIKLLYQSISYKTEIKKNCDHEKNNHCTNLNWKSSGLICYTLSHCDVNNKLIFIYLE